ncbi:hypothetical protein MMC19_007134 [Ptychographa xylographoides]|nr:hypothetical protein [Ptychographa xylographoides]
MFGAIKVLGFEKSAPWSRISSLLALTSLLSVTQAVPSGDTTTTAPSAATVTGSPTPSPAAATSSSTSSGLSAGVQAGIALGVVIPILLLAIGSVYFIRRRKRNQSQGARSGRRPTIPDYESFSAIEGLPHNFPIFPVTANIPVELKGNSTRRPAEQQARPKHERSDSQAPLARDWKPLDVESPASYTYDESPTSASPSKYERSGSKSSHVPWKPMEPPAVHKQERSAGYKRGRAGSTKIPMGRRWNPEELDRRIRLEDANEDLFG